MTPDEAAATAFTEQRRRILATLIRTTGDWDLAEECVQDAFERALSRWPAEGVPRNPGAWLTTTARNRALDRLRRDANHATKLRRLAVETDDPNDELQLLFTCCHPALPLEARVALTLHTIAGLSTEQIAAALLVSSSTMAQRLSRAKRKIRNAAIPYRVPPPELLGERLPGVLAVIYLVFNEGYSGRQQLADEAIRLGRLLRHLMPTETEVRGLLALMLFQHSRARARADEHGDLIVLEEQDRSRWDTTLIAEGLTLLTGTGSPYQLQAEIAAGHSTARTAADTDWPRIVQLYERLGALVPSPVVALNHAVAVAMADGPAAALPLLDALDPTLTGYYLLPATRADLLRRLGRPAEAAAEYDRALALAPTEAERRFLSRRRRSVEEVVPPIVASVDRLRTRSVDDGHDGRTH
ncbi:RNA polymerase sigma factor [Cryptosporangium phraense]|uniref:Sigma-70 family RNA polymerase sigma factor n=1 Tax=Cryptosporangium phraense TaxID=2593070 RepID=A0A545AMH0_9ACTN|nr:sigma-70 family RNA polymerase sigma factor [Cryptosporangium phraense]TQS42513.1 sigma-70 family RNA polymerase sigma factor [Cryptosporangium phraense]